MSGQLNLQRYQNNQVVDHLASHYVLGTLPQRVRKRTRTLMNLPQYRSLAQRINYWENKLASLHNEIPELAPQAQVWQNIEAAIAPASATAEKSNKGQGWRLFGFGVSQWLAAFSLVIAVLLGVNQVQQPDALGSLSYVAVMTDENRKPQVVAATYGESQTLMLDILELPDIDAEQSFELWVTSKTDKQARSLGIIPTGSDSFSRELTVAEWRLIKDSDVLLITVEEYGGSSIGAPMGDVISKGLCIRLSAWQES